MTTRLLINAKWRTQNQVTGVQRYAQGLTNAMVQAGLNPQLLEPRRSGRLATMFWEQRTLPKLAQPGDTLLCPANMAPVNLHPEVRILAVIHCLRFKFHPTSYSRSFVRWYERMIPKIIERADTVFTVSNAQVNEIESVYPHAAGKLQVLSPGFDDVFHPDQPRDAQAPDGRYLIYLGSTTPAKNLQTLIKAYELEPDLPPLVAVGVSSDDADRICSRSVRTRIHALGHINDPARIASLIAHADALVSPSVYESFGLPCMEAMGCGTPVVASDIPAHREVCEDAAVYVPPSDAQAWAATLSAFLNDSARLTELTHRGRERSMHWSWARSVNTLKEILSHQPGRASR